MACPGAPAPMTATLAVMPQPSVASALGTATRTENVRVAGSTAGAISRTRAG